MKRRTFVKQLALAASVAAIGFGSTSLYAQGKTVKIGVLHSLSGTMAISETVLKDVALMAIDEINAKGGVMGAKIEPVVVDPASNWPLFAEKARELLAKDKVAAVFGCWTSVSRKSVLPVFKELDNILFYPVQYEGEELSKNIFYTAEAVNQQAIPAVDYMLGEGKKKFYLLGSDYVYPQTTNLVLLEYLLSKKVPLENIGGGFRKDGSGKIISAGKYTPFGHTDYQQIVAEIKQFAASGDACVISTLNGDTNVPFFKEYAASGLTAETCPVVSFSISEDEFRGLPAAQLVGQLGCWTYFQSINSPANKKFVDDFRKKYGRTPSFYAAQAYDSAMLIKSAVEANHGDLTNHEQVRASLEQAKFDSVRGSFKLGKNHYPVQDFYLFEVVKGANNAGYALNNIVAITTISI